MNEIPQIIFRDALNPTDEEIVKWGYIEGAHYPAEMSQDWDLMVADPTRADLLVKLASDLACPNRLFFLSCLYLIVGDAVRTKGATWPLEKVSQWLQTEPNNGVEEVEVFFKRARALLDDPTSFNYNKWCWSGHAYGIDEATNL